MDFQDFEHPLNRSISAATTGPPWGLSFSYDGFGNRLSQTVTKGSAPASSLSVNTSTNRISSSGYGYDSNGNLTTMPYGAGSITLTYDIENRLIQAVNSNGTEQFGYSPHNRQVQQKLPSGSGGSQFMYFYGANGDRLAKYTYFGNDVFQVAKTDLYFAGRLLAVVDRLGSVRGNKYLPQYGEEMPATANHRDKFATYFRDSSTGLDYAMNRYYGSNLGRFLSPDPQGGSGKPANPQSLNRYAYVGNDPVNKNDPLGLAPEFPTPDWNWTLDVTLLFQRPDWGGPPTMGPGEVAMQEQLEGFARLVARARGKINTTQLSQNCLEIFADLGISIETVRNALNRSVTIDGSTSPNLVQVERFLEDFGNLLFGPAMEPARDVFQENNSYAFTYSHEIYLHGPRLMDRTRPEDFTAGVLFHESLHLPAIGMTDETIINWLNGITRADGRRPYHLNSTRARRHNGVNP